MVLKWRSYRRIEIAARSPPLGPRAYLACRAIEAEGGKFLEDFEV